MRISPVHFLLIGCVALTACGQKGLRDLRPSGTGPDEFRILPSKPLTAPQDYAVLPAPTPGGKNLVDPTPEADAVAALGGRPEALDPSQGAPSSESALITAASRYGVEPGVRTTLAQQDAKFRKRQSRSTRFRLFPVDRYEQAYRKDALDPFQQNSRFRNAGVATPTAPPAVE
jgi:DUF3035 family protein